MRRLGTPRSNFWPGLACRCAVVDLREQPAALVIVARKEREAAGGVLLRDCSLQRYVAWRVPEGAGWLSPGKLLYHVELLSLSALLPVVKRTVLVVLDELEDVCVARLSHELLGRQVEWLGFHLLG